ncbi:hypothetical protein K9K85_00385 [Patescibacteria group bacterium]|nr:hypothetical protein [Patescibacteria group bacterium]
MFFCRFREKVSRLWGAMMFFFFCLMTPAQAINIREGLTSAASSAGLNTNQSLALTVGLVFQKVLGVLGLILLVLFVAGGLMWMTSGGSTDKIKKARGLLINAVIGMVLVILAYALTDLVIGGIEKAIITN